MAYRFLDFELDADRYELRRGGEPVRLEPRVLDLLLYLVRQRDRSVSFEELLERLWDGVNVSRQALHQAVHSARKALGDDARQPRILETIRGRGVRFVAEVTEGRARRQRPGVLHPAAAPPFVGRAEILGDLEDALEDAVAGRGRVVLVGGEPGIGKSRLVEEFAQRARKQGILTHLGRCREDEGAPAYWPWLELLRAHAQHVGPAGWRDLLDAWPQIAQMAPELDPEGRAGEQPELEAGPARFRLFDGVTRMWLGAAEPGGLVLVLDDLHRADTPSWLLLRFLVRDAVEAPVLVVGTYRDPELQRDGARAASFAELAREANGQILTLRGFSREEVADFVATTTEDEPTEDLVDELHRRSAGNPFFLTHLTRLVMPPAGARAPTGLAATEESPAAHSDGALRPIELPLTLREAIARQLSDLPSDTRNLLVLASVAGRAFTLTLLAEASGRPQDEALHHLEAAVAAGVVVPDPEHLGRYRFTHLLVRDALYESIPTPQRVEHHLRIGEALERGAAGDPTTCLAELAHHFRAAVPLAGLERAIEYAEQAGRAAAGRLAFEESVALLRHAVQLLDIQPLLDDRACGVLVALGSAETRIGDRLEARQTFERAARLAQQSGAAEKLAEAALAVSPGFFSLEVGVHDEFCISLIQRALASLPTAPSPLRVQLLARLAMALQWAPDADARREDAASTAERLSAALDDPATSLYVKTARLVVGWGPDNPEERQAVSAEIARGADALGLTELSMMARVFRISSHLEWGRPDRAEAEVVSLATLSQLNRLPQVQWYPVLYRSSLALLRGCLQEAESLAGEFLRLGARVGDANVMNTYGAIVFTIRRHQGRAGETIQPMTDLVHQFPSMVAWRSALAEQLWEAGSRERARIEYEALCRQGLRSIRRDLLWLVTLTQVANLCAQLEDHLRAPELLSILGPYRDRFVTVGYGSLGWCACARVLGQLSALLGRFEDARSHFEKAIEIELHAGAQSSLAETYLEYARALLRRRSSKESRVAAHFAGRATALATELGMVRVSAAAQSVEARARLGS